jgi:hypothetical protein
MAVWATLAAAVFSAVALFQLALALGAPWGDAAYGGQAADADGRLPARFRGMSALAAVFLVAAAVIVLAQGGVIEVSGVSDGTLTAITWALAAMMGLNTLANLASTNRLERVFLGGATAFLALLCILLALG